MRKWIGKLVGFWHKAEHWFTLWIGVLLIISSAVFMHLAISSNIGHFVLLGFCLALILGGIMAFRTTMALYVLKTNRSLVNTYREAYDDLKDQVSGLNIRSTRLQDQLEESIKVCDQWREHVNEWKRHANALQQKYFADADIVFAGTTKHSEILPQQQSMFSNLVSNAAHASTIKSLLEFSSKVDRDTTVFLVRLHHKDSSWHIEVTGREVELDQATYVIKSVEKKLKDFAGKNSLVKNTPKICN